MPMPPKFITIAKELGVRVEFDEEAGTYTMEQGDYDRVMNAIPSKPQKEFMRKNVDIRGDSYYSPTSPPDSPAVTPQTSPLPNLPTPDASTATSPDAPSTNSRGKQKASKRRAPPAEYDEGEETEPCSENELVQPRTRPRTDADSTTADQIASQLPELFPHQRGDAAIMKIESELRQFQSVFNQDIAQKDKRIKDLETIIAQQRDTLVKNQSIIQELKAKADKFDQARSLFR